MKTITDLIELCGGDLTVAFTLTRHQQTVKRWAKRGKVPKIYWHKLAELAGVDYANVKALHKTKR